MTGFASSFEARVAHARAQRDASLAIVDPPLEGIPSELPTNSQGLASLVLTTQENEITALSVTELLEALRQRAITVEVVTRAFLRRAALAQVATNCLTELLWDQAIARAKALDALPEPRGLLFGLPISTKEHHGMVGENVTTTASLASWVGRPHGSNLLYDTLWAEGCVFFARTTQPQLIMHLETNSPLYGRTVNPYNRGLTSGGSSGGESALLGMRGSVLGVGGDIGGSIRCPAAHVGVYGFKPTLKRISVMNGRAIMVGKETIFSTPGPMTVQREGLEIFMSVALASKPWRIDPSLSTRPWEPYLIKKPLKIAVQWWDGVVRPHPPIIRALKEVSEACVRAGMTVIDWDCTSLNHDLGWEILAAMYWPDGGKEALRLLHEGGEPLLPLTRFIIHEQPSVKSHTQEELWELCRKRDAYRTMYAKAWTDTGATEDDEVDVILGPASFGAASPHDQSRYWGYTAHWNLLDYPAAVFPVTTVDPIRDVPEPGYTPLNDQDTFAHNMYDPAKYQDAPVSLQVIGRRERDEKVLAVLEQIERAMGRP